MKNGRPTNQVRRIRRAIKVANALYGTTPVGDFGPLALKACRAAFVAQGLSRRECNRRANLIRQALRWGPRMSWYPPGVHQALRVQLHNALWPVRLRHSLPAVIERTAHAFTASMTDPDV